MSMCLTDKCMWQDLSSRSPGSSVAPASAPTSIGAPEGTPLYSSFRALSPEGPPTEAPASSPTAKSGSGLPVKAPAPAPSPTNQRPQPQQPVAEATAAPAPAPGASAAAVLVGAPAAASPAPAPGMPTVVYVTIRTVTWMVGAAAPRHFRPSALACTYLGCPIADIIASWPFPLEVVSIMPNMYDAHQAASDVMPCCLMRSSHALESGSLRGRAAGVFSGLVAPCGAQPSGWPGPAARPAAVA
jgi:hypothetical protein